MEPYKIKFSKSPTQKTEVVFWVLQFGEKSNWCNFTGVRFNFICVILVFQNKFLLQWFEVTIGFTAFNSKKALNF